MKLPAGQPIRILYDADCSFCTASVHWAQRWVRPDVVFAAWQAEPADLTEPLRPVLETSVVAVREDVVVATGGRAVVLVLHTAPRAVFRWSATVLDLAPLRPLVEGVYRIVARNRHRLPGGTPSCRRPAQGTG